MEITDPVVVHWTREMEAAVAFYRDVFGLRLLVDDAYLSVLDLPPIRLVLHVVDEYGPERPLAHAGLNVEVPDLDAAVGRVLRHGGELVHVREPAPSLPLRVAMCRDVDGNGFELRQRVAAAPR